MKKFLLLVLAVFTSIILLTACQNGGNDKGDTITYTVTFVQEGKEDVVVSVKSGEGVEMADVPQLDEIAGYDVDWDKDFSEVNSDLVVTAVKTPKTFTISYTYDSRLSESGYVVSLEKTTQAVQYNSTYVLSSASVSGGDRALDFVGWKNVATATFFESGRYTLTENVTLIAVFEPQEQEWS